MDLHLRFSRLRACGLSGLHPQDSWKPTVVLRALKWFCTFWEKNTRKHRNLQKKHQKWDQLVILPISILCQKEVCKKKWGPDLGPKVTPSCVLPPFQRAKEMPRNAWRIGSATYSREVNNHMLERKGPNGWSNLVMNLYNRTYKKNMKQDKSKEFLFQFCSSKGGRNLGTEELLCFFPSRKATGQLQITY